jgi:hypothetical protein
MENFTAGKKCSSDLIENSSVMFQDGQADCSFLGALLWVSVRT